MKKRGVEDLRPSHKGINAMSQANEQKEKPLAEPERVEEIHFCWGVKKGCINFYESFTLEGIEYSLYDTVYLWSSGLDEPSIGKLIKILETENHEKKVEVVWFFRPSEIRNYLGDVRLLDREIFLACGEGEGLSKAIQLEAICGKCNVVCSSKDKRNPHPTEKELRMADNIFHRSFDVKTCKVSEEFPSSIAGIEVGHFFNRSSATSSVFTEAKSQSKARSEVAPVRAIKNDQSARVEKTDFSTSSGGHMKSSIKEQPRAGGNMKRSVHFLSTSISDIGPTKKRKLSPSSGNRRDGTLPKPPTKSSEEEKYVNGTSSGGPMKSSIKEQPRAGGNMKRSVHFLSMSPSYIGPTKKRKLYPSSGNQRDGTLPKPPTKSSEEEKYVNGTSSGGHMKSSIKEQPRAGGNMKRSVHFLSMSPSYIGPTKKRKLSPSSGNLRDGTLPKPPTKSSEEEKYVNGSCRENKDLSTRKSLHVKTSESTGKGPITKQHLGPSISYKYSEVTRRPVMDSSKWLKLEVWSEGRLNEANERGTLAVLENLDPSFTSSEVEDILWHVFKENVKAKMVPCTSFSSPHSGRAIVIFKTKDAADTAIAKLISGCLVLDDGRPIVCRRRLPRKFGDAGRFVGHLTIDIAGYHRQREEIRNAVSTSHFSQPNTVEFEMALYWRALQEKSDIWYAALHEEQEKEIEAMMKQMKDHYPEQK